MSLSATSAEPERCANCGLTYSGGKHETGGDGRFPPGGHYFEEVEYDDEGDELVREESVLPDE